MDASTEMPQLCIFRNIRPRGYKKIMLKLTHLSIKFFLLINVKMPTVVGILTFMSRKNSILGLSELEKKMIFLIFLLMSI